MKAKREANSLWIRCEITLSCLTPCILQHYLDSRHPSTRTNYIFLLHQFIYLFNTENKQKKLNDAVFVFVFKSKQRSCLFDYPVAC
jgi:hypothetical protein